MAGHVPQYGGFNGLEINDIIMGDGVTVASLLSIAMMYAEWGGWQEMSRKIVVDPRNVQRSTTVLEHFKASFMA